MDLKNKDQKASIKTDIRFPEKLFVVNGATWKRRTHSESKVKYYAYACGTHIKKE